MKRIVRMGRGVKKRWKNEEAGESTGRLKEKDVKFREEAGDEAELSDCGIKEVSDQSSITSFCPERDYMDDGSTKRITLLVVTVGAFLTPFDVSSVNVALPSIGKEFSMDAISLSWVATAYLLASAIFLVPFGRIADIHGRKRIFTIGILTFTLASFSMVISSICHRACCFQNHSGNRSRNAIWYWSGPFNFGLPSQRERQGPGHIRGFSVSWTFYRAFSWRISNASLWLEKHFSCQCASGVDARCSCFLENERGMG